MTRFVVDTGPIVALLNHRDAHHAWARELLATIRPPLLTCDAVLSEACFLLRTARGGGDAVLELVERGALALSFRLGDECKAVRRLMARYANVPMSLADACLVRMSELDGATQVITLDRDFRVYRKLGRHAIPIVSPRA